MVYVIAFLGGLFCIGCIFSFSRGDYESIITTNLKWMPFVTLVCICYGFISLIGEAVPLGETVTELVEVKKDWSDDVYYWNLKVKISKDDGSHDYDILGFISPDTGKFVEVESAGYEYLGDENYFYYSDEEYTVTVNRKDVRPNFLQTIQYIGLFNGICYLVLFIASIWASILVLKHWNGKSK